METQITRAEHEEFMRRMDTENKRLADEDARQNKRLDLLEASVRDFGFLAASVEKLATCRSAFWSCRMRCWLSFLQRFSWR